METLPARQKCFAQVILEDAQRANGTFEERAPSTIDFSGLNDLEVRGQCAMVRLAVDTHLDRDCKSVVWAMYAHGAKKMVGVRKVRDYCLSALNTKDEMAALAMTWNVYGTQEQRKGLSVRDIADEFNLPPATIQRDIRKLREAVVSLEIKALGVLEGIFETSGVCEAF
jgi:Trp operon repressor